MLEEVYDKGDPYYCGYMLGVIEAEVRVYRRIMKIMKSETKKDRAAIVAEMQKIYKSEESRECFDLIEKYRHLPVEYIARHILEESEFFRIS